MTLGKHMIMKKTHAHSYTHSDRNYQFSIEISEIKYKPLALWYNGISS